MDYRNAGESWQWQNGGYCNPKDSSYDIPESMWDGGSQDEDFTYILEKSSPVRVPTHFGSHGGSNKRSGGFREASSQAKKRRTLQFNDGDLDLTFDSSFLRSEERIDTADEVLTQTSQWGTRTQEGSSSSGLECLDESESWLADCFNDFDLLASSVDTNSPSSTDFQIDGAEFCAPPPSVRAHRVQEHTLRTAGNITFKGTKSYMQTSTKPTSSVICPFSFIKPSDVNGDLTLNQINQQIRTPQSHSKEDDPAILGTSPFTGKPVVNKTRIRTGGGSITIMRTKG